MRKFRFLFLLLVATLCSPAICHAQSLILRSDTISRVDTITAQEVMTRTEVIQRTEKIIRYYDNGSLVEKKIEENGNVIESEPVASGLEIITSPGNGSTDSNNVIYVDTLYQPGGKYVWIPDSMSVKVNSILENGETDTAVRIEEFDSPTDLNEKVSFRGKTLPMVLKSRNLGRFDRGLFNFLFIPKGIWQLGLTASYGEFSTENLQLLDLVSDIDFKGKIFSVKPYFAYFLKSNISLGLRLGYTRGEANIGAFNVDIDEDMSFNLHDIMYKSASYSAAVTFTQYLGITRRGRFAVFNEVELAMAGGDSDFNRPFNGEMRKTHTTTFELGLNFSPGVSVYIIDPLSFNVSLGVFGLNLKHEKQKVNDEELGWRTTSGANFRFNIFNINFGIAVNI